METEKNNGLYEREDEKLYERENEKYMDFAVELAKKGAGAVNPNPLVGAVIVKDGEVIGSGFHEKYGSLHAERNALLSCKQKPEGAVMYVTLEPCCHHGKTPPCTQAIIESGISGVVIGSYDPNPLVSGGGIKVLKDAGIRVTTDFCREKCDKLNSVFFHYISTKTPYVTLKYAMTLDGKIATKAGLSKWISCEESRIHTHRFRSENMGIMVGVNTVLKDDPELTCRNSPGISPIRIVCDTHLKTPLTSKLVQTAGEAPEQCRTPRTIIATAVKNESLLAPYKEAGVEILRIEEDKDNHISLKSLMRQLGEKKIDSVILEGGGTLAWSALNAGIVNRVQAYISPKVFGGDSASTPVAGRGVTRPDDAFKFKNIKTEQIGDDIFWEGEIEDVYGNH